MAEAKNVFQAPVPEVVGWRRKGSDNYPESRHPFLKLSPAQLVKFAPFGFRYLVHALNKRILKGRRTPMERPVVGESIYGVPLGGVGSGTIGRGFRGEFARFQMCPGIYKYHTVWADAFHLVLRDAKDDKVLLQTVLGSKKSSERGGRLLRRSRKNPPKAWKYEVKDADIEYVGLYPQAWMTYNFPELRVKVHCRQISPFIPHNYTDSCLPSAAFEFHIENDTPNQKLKATLGFTFKNGWGSKRDHELNPWTEDIKYDEGEFGGAQMHQTTENGMKLTYGIGAKKSPGVKVQRMEDFDPDSDGQDLLNFMLRPPVDTVKRPDKGANTKNVCMGVRADFEVQCGEMSEAVEFALVWDMPKIKFGKGLTTWDRRYTRFIQPSSSETDKSCAAQLLSYTFGNQSRWTRDITAWQAPVLDDPVLPTWFKSALFNEMYYIADGGSQWIEMPGDLVHGDPRKEFGRFCYLESHEYRMYNTYDVHFYASCALVALFPGLQAAIQADFCYYTAEQDDRITHELYTGKKVVKNAADFVPHDLGDPEGEPFLQVNAYRVHDIADWKDLNLKFVISIARDLKVFERRANKKKSSEDLMLGEAATYLRNKAWPVVLKCLTLALEWDEDGDDLIENGGFPDQTFDTWAMSGSSAYCGGLWLAALTAAVAMAKEVNEAGEAERWGRVLKKASEAYKEKLWDEERGFIKFDTSKRGPDTVMADQLCGHWYLLMSGLPPYLTQSQVDATLETIYRLNVCRFKEGRMGAVNGIRIDKLAEADVVDHSCPQSEEMWTGVTYALASLMIAEGRTKDGFKTAEGVYESVWNTFGQAYETPEAAYENDVYRAIGYMRPLSIWAMYDAWRSLDKTKRKIK